MPGPRWATNFTCGNDAFPEFWHELASTRGRRMLLICGVGFDPRALNALRVIIGSGLAKVACQLIEFDEGPESSSHRYADATERNRRDLWEILPDNPLEPLTVQMRSQEGRNVGGRRLSEALQDPSRYMEFTDVVVDITSLPRGLYFPAIGTLLNVWLDPRSDLPKAINLHVVVCENAYVDSQIEEEGGDKVEWLHGFSGDLSLRSAADSPRIWAPVLGGGQRTRLLKIHDFVNPKEICPVLPFPASDPRRGDRIVSEYRELLFDAWDIDSRDVIYAAEQNPFDVYRQLCGLDERYRSVLRSLGGASTVVSAHSSKLLSLGVLLAAYERHLGVPQIEPTGYSVADGIDEVGATGELFEIWLAGEAYES